MGLGMASYWLKAIREKLPKTPAQKLTDKMIAHAEVLLSDKMASVKQLTYIKHLCERMGSEACVEKIVKHLKDTPQKLLTSPEVVETDIPGYTAATMSRVPSESTFRLTVMLLVTSITIVILLLAFLVELEFISCGPLTRALRSHIPSYDAHITAYEKRSEIEDKVEKMEAETKAQVEKMETETKAQVKKMQTECKEKIKSMEAVLKMDSWNIEAWGNQRVKERKVRLLAEGAISEEAMLFSWIDFFVGMAKLIKERWLCAIYFCLGLEQPSVAAQKEKRALEVQTAEKETQVEGIVEVVNEEAEEDKEWSVL
jgi:uncharacterized lipoprotein YehR (DUF1307 family)